MHPLRTVKQLKKQNQRLRHLSAEELSWLLSVSPPYLRAVVMLAVNTGLRTGELMHLTCTDVNFQSGFISTSPQSKNGQRRDIPMNQAVRRTLERMCRRAPSNRMLPQGFRGSFAAGLKRVGIEDFRFHDLRHTFASDLVMSSVDIRTVQDCWATRSSRWRCAIGTFRRRMWASPWPSSMPRSTPRPRKSVDTRVIFLFKPPPSAARRLPIPLATQGVRG